MTAPELLDFVHKHLDQPLEKLGLQVATQLKLQGKELTTVRQVVSYSRATMEALLRNGKETGNRGMRDLDERLHEFCPFLSIGMKVPGK